MYSCLSTIHLYKVKGKEFEGASWVKLGVDFSYC